MQRFLMLAGVAVVAGAMYVAGASGSQQSAGPSAKQFNALKSQVASLSKTVKTVKKEAADADGFIQACLLSSNSGIVPINQFGDTSTGFLFGTTGSATSVRSALDVDTQTPAALLLAVDPTCVTNSALRHGSTHSVLSTLHLRAR